MEVLSMDKSEDKYVFSTVPISIPIFIPGAEDFRMGGFAFADDFGLILSFRREGDPTLDPISNFRSGFSNSNSAVLRTSNDPLDRMSPANRPGA